MSEKSLFISNKSPLSDALYSLLLEFFPEISFEEFSSLDKLNEEYHYIIINLYDPANIDDKLIMWLKSKQSRVKLKAGIIYNWNRVKISSVKRLGIIDTFLNANMLTQDIKKHFTA